MQHTLQSPQPSARQGTFTFPIISRNKTPGLWKWIFFIYLSEDCWPHPQCTLSERRAASPLYLPFVRSGSLLKRSPSPNLSRAKRRVRTCIREFYTYLFNISCPRLNLSWDVTKFKFKLDHKQIDSSNQVKTCSNLIKFNYFQTKLESRFIDLKQLFWI